MISLTTLIGIRKFIIIPKYNSEYINNRLSENVSEMKFLITTYHRFTGNFYDKSFDLYYYYGKSIGSNLEGEMKDEKIELTCKPLIPMFLVLFFIIGIIFSGFTFYNSGNGDRNTGLILIFAGIIGFIISVLLVNSMHKGATSKFVNLIGGGTIMDI